MFGRPLRTEAEMNAGLGPGIGIGEVERKAGNDVGGFLGRGRS